MKKRALTLGVAAACLCACLFALAGCGSDQSKLEGEWQVTDTEVTVVFTEDELKTVTETFGYTMDTSEKTINYTSGDIDFGSAEYSFSDDGQTLTLVEDDGSGGTTTTTFTKLSDDTSAEPSADISEDSEISGADDEDFEEDEGSEEESEDGGSSEEESADSDGEEESEE